MIIIVQSPYKISINNTCSRWQTIKIRQKKSLQLSLSPQSQLQTIMIIPSQRQWIKETSENAPRHAPRWPSRTCGHIDLDVDENPAGGQWKAIGIAHLIKAPRASIAITRFLSLSLSPRVAPEGPRELPRPYSRHEGLVMRGREKKKKKKRTNNRDLSRRCAIKVSARARARTGGENGVSQSPFRLWIFAAKSAHCTWTFHCYGYSSRQWQWELMVLRGARLRAGGSGCVVNHHN